MKRPKNRYRRALQHLIEDVEKVECPYCGKQMQFLHWQHLISHNKHISDVRRDFPKLPTMTLNESLKRKDSRNGCTEKIKETCEERYGGVGFASDDLALKTRHVIKERYGNRNVMKTEHGKKYFRGELNPLKNPEIARRVSKALKGRCSPHKGKTYEEILGEEIAEKRKKELKKSGAYGQSLNTKISAPQLELFKMVKEKYPTAVLEYIILDYCLDIAVPDLKLCFEYDGSYWHDPEKDKIRDEVLFKLGWKVFRFIDTVPNELPINLI